jgi:hypothetical protein
MFWIKTKNWHDALRRLIFSQPISMPFDFRYDKWTCIIHYADSSSDWEVVNAVQSAFVALRSLRPYLCHPAKSNTARFLVHLSDRGCGTTNQRRGEKLWILTMEDEKLIEVICTHPILFNIKLTDYRNIDKTFEFPEIKLFRLIV